MLADSRSPRDAVIGGTPPPDVAGLGTKWESRVLTAARYSSSPLTCARGSPAETRKRPGGGDVDAFLGVKGSPVQIRPSRRRSEAGSGFPESAFCLLWEPKWERAAGSRKPCWPAVAGPSRGTSGWWSLIREPVSLHAQHRMIVIDTLELSPLA